MAKSTVNKAGNYTKPTMRKQLFQRIKAGGKGGGGSSSGSACGPGPGTANTGGGAAGARGSNTGPLNGGSGIVVIRYKFQN